MEIGPAKHSIPHYSSIGTMGYLSDDYKIIVTRIIRDVTV